MNQTLNYTVLRNCEYDMSNLVVHVIEFNGHSPTFLIFCSENSVVSKGMMQHLGEGYLVIKAILLYFLVQHAANTHHSTLAVWKSTRYR
jgi:hypothetical protein